MKLIQFLLFIVIFLPVTGIGQTLPSPVFSQIPCYTGPQNTETVKVVPVVSATVYTWTSHNPANGLLFNGQPGPYQTTIPEVEVSFNMILASFKLGVVASSACCTSDTSFAAIWHAKIEFDQSNDSTALPNTSSQYSIHPYCNQPSTTWEYFWYVNGDIGINGTGSNYISTPGGTPFIELNFGPAFTTGELCVWAITNSGIPTDTICMNISGATGMPGLSNNNFHIYYDHSTSDMVIKSAIFHTQPVVFTLFDMKGSKVFQKSYNTLIPDNKYRIPFVDLIPGIYYLSVNGASVSTRQKIVVSY